jgi:hypothetical protein
MFRIFYSEKDATLYESNSTANTGDPGMLGLFIISALATWNTLFSHPSNLKSSPYLSDQGNAIGLNPEPEISF